MEETNLNNHERLIKKYYLVDYDNTGYSGLNGIEELDNESVVTIFYSKKAQSIPIQFFQKFLECKANVKFYPIENEDKNIINFQISAYLGYVLGDDKTADCCIVSNDNKLEFLQNFGNTKDIEIKILPSVSGEKQEFEEVSEPDEKSEFYIAVESLNLSLEDKSSLFKILDLFKSGDITMRKQHIQANIKWVFGEGNALGYYRAIKKLIK